MTVIAEKTKSRLVLTADLAFGILCFVLLLAFPILLFSAGGIPLFHSELITVYIIIGIFILLCLGGGFWLIGRYITQKNLPTVLLEADEENLYVHGKIERIIPFSDILGADIIGTPESLFVYVCQDRFGTLTISPVKNGKKVVLHFVNQVTEVPERMLPLLRAYLEKHPEMNE